MATGKQPTERTDGQRIAAAITGAFVADENDGTNLAEALLALANTVGYGLKMLGNGGAATPMGAIEALGVEIKEASQRIADGLNEVAEAIRDHK